MEKKVDKRKDECGGLVTQWGAAEAVVPVHPCHELPSHP